MGYPFLRYPENSLFNPVCLMETTKTPEEKLANLTPEQKAQIEEIERNAIANFKGQFDELEMALGMLKIGHHVGWKVLVIIHNKRTIRKYEEILGIHIREFFPEEGPSSYRSNGYMLAKKLGNFWKAVSGDIKIENRRDFGSSENQ